MTVVGQYRGYRPVTPWRPVARLLTAFVLVASLLAALPMAVSAEVVQVFADDFESDAGWEADPAGTDTASTGNWERGNPETTSYQGTKQLGDTTSGSNGLVTGASAGSSVGANDIDNGVTSIQSPVISLANVSTAELSFDYYLAHLDNSSSDDFFRVSVVGETTAIVFSEEGASNDDDASWQRATLDISSFAGQSIRILVEAADASNPSLVEAGLDTLLITGDAVGVNQPPSVTSPGAQRSTEGHTVSLQIVGSDADEDVITWSAAGLPADLSIDSGSGLISGTIAADTASETPLDVSVTASDGIDSTTVNFPWTIDEAGENQSPIPVNPGDQVSVEGDAVSLQLEATDPDGDPVQFFTEVLPTGLTLDNATGLISGTLAEGAADGSPWATSIAVSDGISPEVVVSFSWTVTAPNENQAPVVTSPGDQQSEEGDVISLAVVGTDADEDPLAWSATGLPADLVIDTETGVISGTVADGAEAASPYSVAVSADDGTEATTVNFVWSVADGTTPNTIITGTITDANGDPFIPAQVDQFTVGPNGERGEFILSRDNVPAGTYTIFTEPGCYFLTFVAPDGQTYNGGGFFTPPSFCVEEGQTQVVDAQLDPIGNPETVIGGTVLSETGGAEGVQVDLFQANADGSRGSYLNTTNTAADGTYSFDVAAGCFVMTFIAPEGETFNGLGYFNNGGCVEAGETVSDVDANLDGVVTSDAAIGGVVTLGDGSPAAGVSIDLFTQAADGSRETYLASRTTDAEGVYSFDVDPGSYVLTFIALPGETFNGDGYLSLPQAVVAEQIITDLNAAMDGAAASSIGGTVTDGTGAPAPGVGVDLFEANADGSRGSYLRSDATDAAGQYSIGADAGCYILTFIATGDNTFNDSRYLSLPQCVEAGETVTDLDAQYDGDSSGTVIVSIGNGATPEGDAGQVRQVILPVTLSEPAAASESITVSTADDTATAGSDYVALTTTITFAPGETEKLVSFDVLGDDVFEQVDGVDERFDVLLSDPSAGLVIGDGAGFARIIEDDEPVVIEPTLSIADASATEADVDGVVSVTVTMSETADADVTVDVATADGTAVDVEDYVAGAATLTIPAGSTTVNFDVIIVGDDVEEATEEFSVSLSNPVGATIAEGTATVTIEDDDAPLDAIQISVSDVTVTELDDGTRNAVVTFSLDQAPVGTSVRVDFTTVDGTATVEDNDYLALSGTVSFASGSTSRIRAVKIVGDRDIEPDETLTLVLSNPLNAEIADGEALITILNND